MMDRDKLGFSDLEQWLDRHRVTEIECLGPDLTGVARGKIDIRSDSEKLGRQAELAGVLAEAGLSYVGLGAQPPMPEWGAMIASGRRFILDQWWVATMPGIAILIVSLGFNLLGDGLRDALDPREAGR